MSGIFFVLRWTLLSVMLCASSVTVKRSLRLKGCFAPIVTLCIITILVYFGGLIGLLQPMCLAIVAGCVASALYEGVRYHKTPYLFRELPVIQALFLLGTLCFLGILSQNTLVHYDNFTHWGLVVKEMLITHAFPTADSVLIEFTNYPTGSASWIYFVCTVVGHGENSMIMAQALMIFAGLYAVFGVIQERGRFLLIVAMGMGLSLLSIFNLSIRINNLLVDFLLPVLALAAIALISCHRREENATIFAAVPILAVLVVVKSSGIIFAAISLVYLVYVVLAYRVRRGNLRILWQTAVAIVLSILPLVGWNIRMNTVFANVSNKFETDLDVINSGFGGKTAEEVRQICLLFWQTITDITQRSTMGLLLFQVIAVIACLIGCCYLKKKWVLPKVLIAMDFVVVFYLLGILAMYVFSMPMEEAIYLAAFDRYSSSIVILFGGVLLIALIGDLERSFHYRLGEIDDMHAFKSIETKLLYLRSSIACLVVLLLVLTSEYNGMVYQTNVDHGGLSGTVKEIVGDCWDEAVDDSKYLLFASDANGDVSNYYLNYVAKYYLRAHNVDAICLFYEDNFLNLLSQYDYLVIIETSDEEQALMQDYFGLSGLPGIYDTAELLSSI